MNYLTIEETATLMKVDPRTVQRWIADRRISFVRVHRTVRVPEKQFEHLTTPAEKRPHEYSMV